MDNNEIIILSLGGILFLKYLIYDPLISFWEKNPSFIKILIAIWKTIEFKLLLGGLVFIGLIILFIRYKIKNHKETIKIQIRNDKLKDESYKIEQWLEKNLEYLGSKELKKFIGELDNLYLSEETENKFEVKIKTKLIEANDYLEKNLHQEEFNRYNFKKEKITQEIQDLRSERFQEELKNENKNKIILERLDPNENLIYESDKLKPEEIEILKKEDFKEVNEYDPIYKENTNFLVKQILNHSTTHTFLVGRIGDLLNQQTNVNKVYFHETRDADITFEVDYKIYAFEIETGTLLAKMDQLKKKVSLLNNKYGRNWYFIVTNRNLAKKYRKYGQVTSRMGVCKIIEKLVKK
ncbi:MAG: hypothetical protein KKF50_03105 [Nanoarchaeota archaeon]|nr:hypothetical protein [Nanoarchaeota archaeon]